MLPAHLEARAKKENWTTKQRDAMQTILALGERLENGTLDDATLLRVARAIEESEKFVGRAVPLMIQAFRAGAEWAVQDQKVKHNLPPSLSDAPMQEAAQSRVQAILDQSAIAKEDLTSVTR